MLYDHLRRVIVVLWFVVLKISYSYVLDSESPFMGATVLRLKPRRDSNRLFHLPVNDVLPVYRRRRHEEAK